MGKYLGRALRGAGKALEKGINAADDLIDGPVTDGIKQATNTGREAVNKATKDTTDRTHPSTAAGSDNLITDSDGAEPVILGSSSAKRDENQLIRVTKDDQMYPMDDRETGKISQRLDPGEAIVMSVRQSRVKPGGANINPSTIFVTKKRVIIRSPTRMGLGENIEEHEYGVIRSIQLEKGVMSSSLEFFMAGNTPGTTIRAIPKAKAEAVYHYVRGKIHEAKERSMKGTFDQPVQPVVQPQDDLLAILKKRYISGEITREEFLDMKKDLEL